MKPVVIGIAGGSGSGKSTVSSRVAAHLGEQCLHLHHDRYYHSLPIELRSNPLAHNFDHPQALDTTRLVDNLQGLRAGAPVEAPVYDFPSHTRATRDETLHPRPVILVEGILVLADERLRVCFDHRVYVHAPDDIRLARRIRRDMASRGRDPHEILDQYERTVRPMHLRYVEPSRDHADLVLDGTSPIDGLVRRVMDLLAW